MSNEIVYPTHYYGCGCGYSIKDNHKRDCYFFHEEPHMGAHILCCTYDASKALGYCPCEDKGYECPNYIKESEVGNIVREYIREREEERHDVEHYRNKLEG